MKRLLALLCAGASLLGQATHYVTVSWADPGNPDGTTYTVYRASGTCAGTPTFLPQAVGLNVLTFDDMGLTPGDYCYYITAALDTDESTPSNTVDVTVPPPPFTRLTGKTLVSGKTTAQ